MKVFPKQIFVKWNGDGDGFLDANETPDSFDDGDRVAIYERREILLKRITYDLTQLKPRRRS